MVKEKIGGEGGSFLIDRGKGENLESLKLLFAELVWENYPPLRTSTVPKNSQISSVNLSGKILTLDRTS